MIARTRNATRPRALPEPAPARRNPPWPGALAALVGLLLGCGQGPLSGSVDALFPLHVSWVDVLRNEEALQVSYYANRGTEVDLVVRLTVVLEDVEVVHRVKIPLQGEYAPGHLRTTVLHLAGGEPGRVFAPVHRGDLVIEQGGAPFEQTRGNFSMSFEQGTGYGSGRTLEGTFAGMAQDAGFGP